MADDKILEQILTEIKDMKQDMDKRFDNMDKRMDSMEQDIKEIKTDFRKLDREVTESHKEIKAAIIEIKDRLDNTTIEVTKLDYITNGIIKKQAGL